MRLMSKNGLKLTAAATAASLLLAACGGKDKDEPKKEVEKDASETETMDSAPTGMDDDIEPFSCNAATEGDGPAMWKVADDDSEIYLLGTFHVLPPEIEWDSDTFGAAMTVAPVTYFEADTTSPEAQQQLFAAVQQYGLNAPGETLSGQLGEERAAAFKEIAESNGLPMSQLETLRPWLAVLTLSQVMLQKSGFDIEAGAEAVILAAANQEGDEIKYLETAVSQIEMFAGLDQDAMLAEFDTSLDQFANFGDILTCMAKAWSVGDVATLEDEIVAPLRDESREAFDAIFANRNANWVDQIETMMAGEGAIFIAVGAGHLVGEDSVVDMLGDKGYTVERVQ